MQAGVQLEERDFFLNRFSLDELRILIGAQSPSNFFSWNSPSFKRLQVDRASLSDDQIIDMMLQEPRLIRRPLALVNGELIVETDQLNLLSILP